ncbi:hypothetical protein [Chromobacterium violaceum]|uniref:hypothetical protein n=1 Tax=Chromobacterium violaceum TaxID=536 RepID=UPI002161780C|nr:hypothetical protein [Chromobacterium violaceum]
MRLCAWAWSSLASASCSVGLLASASVSSRFRSSSPNIRHQSRLGSVSAGAAGSQPASLFHCAGNSLAGGR